MERQRDPGGERGDEQPGDDEGQRSEDEEQDQQRERYRELLEEFRTILPGVQVIFAFLLTVPFSGRFPELDRVGRLGYLAAVVGTALAMVVFLAPTMLHRLAPGRGRDERLAFGVRMQVAGMVILGVALTSATFVVVRFVFGGALGMGLGAGAAAVMAVLWIAYPLHRRGR